MKKSSIFLIMIVFTFFLSSCKYSFIVPEEVTPPDPENPIIYSTQVQPIFNAKCIECHKTGSSTKPDLTVGNSYNQIVPAHVNLTTPEESDIYKYPLVSTSMHAWKKYSANEANIVLTWIKEGAVNN